MKPAPEPVIVTGMGIVCSIGHSVPAFDASLRAGRSGVGFLDAGYEQADEAVLAAMIRDFSPCEVASARAASLPASRRTQVLRRLERAPLPLQCAVAVTLEAWLSAGLDQSPVAPEDVSLVVGGANINQTLQASTYLRHAEAPEHVNPRYSLQFMDTDHVGSLSELLGIRGEGFTVGGASASGNVAITKAAQLLRLGLAEVGVVVGALADLSGAELAAFRNLGALAAARRDAEPAALCRPFDSAHRGFVYGQASACLILETRASAASRGAPALAELWGESLVLDGNSLSDPSVQGEARAMNGALTRAGWSPGDVDYVNTHGTSAALGDEVELAAIASVFHDPRARPKLNATKALTGHCLWSAGVVEAIATVLQLSGGYLHGNPNLVAPIVGGYAFSGASAEPSDAITALSNSFGFGGINSSIALRKGRTKT